MTKLVARPFIRSQLVNNFDQLFENIWKSTLNDIMKSDGFSLDKNVYPKIDILDYDDRVEIEVELPARYGKEDVTVTVTEGGVLLIEGKKKTDYSDEVAKRYLVREIKRSSFVRSITLGDQLDETNVEANFEVGLLRIRVPKRNTKEIGKSRVVEIK